MSELKAFDITVAEEGYCEGIVKYRRHVYDKSEADKVIAELEDKARHYPMMAALIESGNKEIAELKDRLQAADKQIENLINSASSLMLSQDKVNDNKCAELRHSNYKRCLAMARFCRSCWVAKIFIHEGSDRISMHYMKWEKRWLELAEKFKEAK